MSERVLLLTCLTHDAIMPKTRKVDEAKPSSSSSKKSPSPDTTTNKASTTPNTPSTSWNVKIGFAAVVISFVAYYYSSWSAIEDTMPETYALCSSEGTADIYTVDENNTSVECILVRGSWIVDSGGLGE